jgi:hypothetical protein
VFSATELIAEERANDAAPPDAVQVGAIDMKRVFDAFRSYRKAKAELDAQVAAEEHEVRRQHAVIGALVDATNELEHGSAEYVALERDIREKSTILIRHIESAKARLIKAESEMYLQSYREIQRVVAAIAAERNIQIVLRETTEAQAKRSKLDNEILRMLDHPVVYPNPRNEIIDLTSAVIRRINPPGGWLEPVEAP